MIVTKQTKSRRKKRAVLSNDVPTFESSVVEVRQFCRKEHGVGVRKRRTVYGFFLKSDLPLSHLHDVVLRIPVNQLVERIDAGLGGLLVDN